MSSSEEDWYDTGPLQQNRISFLHINAQSLENKMRHFELEAEEHDIVAVSETWFHKDTDQDGICLDGFHPPIRKDREENRMGGVALYLRTNLPIKHRPEIKTEGVESVWVETIINKKKILVGAMYRPPN